MPRQSQPLWYALLGAGACAPAPTTDTQAPEIEIPAVSLADLDDAALTVEDLALDADGARALAPHQILWRRDGVARLVDERAPESPAELGDAAHVAGAWSADAPLVALDGALSWLRGDWSDGFWLEPVALDGAIAPIERAEPGDGETWLWGAGSLYRLAGGALSQIQIDGYAIQDFAIAPGGLLWLATPELIGLDAALSVQIYAPDHRATSLAADGDGALWWTDGDGALYARRPAGEIARFDPGAPARRALANPQAPDTWILTDGGALHHRGGVFSAADLPAGEWLDVDAAGRLLIAGDGGLVRAAHRRPVAFAGLRPGDPLAVRTEIHLLPSDPDSLTALSAWVGDVELDVDDWSGAVLLDPDAITGGGALRAIAFGPEGATTSELPLAAADLPAATWDDDVEPLYRARCAGCHGEAGNPPLATADDWRAHIDAILDAVSSGNMPLSGPALTEDEILLIRGWREGGYP